MWLLTSLGRPDRVRQFFASYAWTDERVALVLYEKDPTLDRYRGYAWPASWTVEIVPMPGNGPTYNEMLRRYPDERCYGFLADDTLLTTPGMLKELEVAAGDWNVAYANDQHHGDKIPTMPCLGGELVRAVGYLAPRQLVHWGLDCAWYDIGNKTGGLNYQPHLIYTHLNPVWGTAPDDSTYRKARQASFGYQDLYRSWLHGGDFKAAVTRVRNLKPEQKTA